MSASNAPTWAWPLYPFGKNSAMGCYDATARGPYTAERNIRLSSDVTLSPTARLEAGRAFRVLLHNANRNQMNFGVGHQYYLPTAEDVARVRLLCPDLTDPENPNWLDIKIKLRGKAHAELAKLTPPELLALLAATEDPPVTPPNSMQQGEGEKAADPYADLRQLARDLSKQQRAVIEALCNAGGELSLANVKTLCDWQDPIESAWNSLRIRLNKKLESHGWKVKTQGRAARLTQPNPK